MGKSNVDVFHLTFITVITLLLGTACVEPISVDPEMNGGEGLAGTESMDGELTETLVSSVLMLRVLPFDTSLGAEVFCTGVAIQPKLIITSASCFRAGVRYAEVLSGSEINFFNNNPRLAVVTEVYKHPAFSPSLPVNNGADLAIVHVDQQLLIPLVEPFVGDLSSTSANLLRVGYLPNEDISFRRQVSFGLNPNIEQDLVSFSTDPSDNEPVCLVSGAPVLALIDNKPQLIAVSSRGDDSCTNGGNASLLRSSVNFINQASRKEIELPEGEQAQVQGGLNCAQAFKCYNVPSCLLYLTPEAQEQINALFTCAQEQGCQSTDCYETSCPELFNECIGL